MRAAAAAAGTVALALLLCGCSLTDGMQHRRQGTAASTRALQLAWRTPASTPDWVPAGATRIRYLAVTAGPADRTPATVRAHTSGALPADCTEIPRRSSAALDPAWAPASIPDRVQRCCNWAVVPVDDGWFGWTPLAPVPAG